MEVCYFYFLKLHSMDVDFIVDKIHFMISKGYIMNSTWVLWSHNCMVFIWSSINITPTSAKQLMDYEATPYMSISYNNTDWLHNF
jgi:hypothetical protein